MHPERGRQRAQPASQGRAFFVDEEHGPGGRGQPCLFPETTVDERGKIALARPPERGETPNLPGWTFELATVPLTEGGETGEREREGRRRVQGCAGAGAGATGPGAGAGAVLGGMDAPPLL
jgi:hypothetical protein